MNVVFDNFIIILLELGLYNGLTRARKIENLIICRKAMDYSPLFPIAPLHALIEDERL